MSLLLGLTLATFPAWQGAGSGRYLGEIAGQMVSYGLLLALGFALALRCGAIDLSVWACAGIGGLAGAWSINAGVAPAAALLIAGVCGLAVGAFNGAVVAWLKMPSVVVTLVVAVVITWAAGSFTETRSVPVPDRTFAGWHLVKKVVIEEQGRGRLDEQPSTKGELVMMESAQPLSRTRMLLVAAVYAAVMFTMMALEMAEKRGVAFSERGRLFTALCVSGGVSALGGAFWLIEYSAAPVPTRPIGDLRVVAAAVLAGGAFFAGRGRGMLVGICLPVAMLLATIWQQEVWALEFRGYSLQLLILTGMTVTAHLAMVEAVKPKVGIWPLRIASVTLAVAGILSLAVSAAATSQAAHDMLHGLGLGLWLAGAIVLLLARLLSAHGSSG